MGRPTRDRPARRSEESRGSGATSWNPLHGMQLAHGEVRASRREHAPKGQGPTLLLGLAAANRNSRRPVARREAVALACRPMTPAAAFDAQNLEALLEGLAGFTA